MRSDDNTTGTLEYTEHLSWLIFLKVFEDLEKRFEEEAKFAGKSYTKIIEPRYRWSSWATKDWKGEELTKFITNDLFPYLKSLSGSPEKEMIATIFKEIRGVIMKSPYNLKDVITIIDKVDFNSAEDSHVLSQVYEELLLKMGREGGTAGEFYTPRPVVRLMVRMINPQIGETVFDPFCGSGGFLIEAFKYMLESRELTTSDYEVLQRKAFYGQEKKALAYLVGIMNCIVHGLLTPNIVRKNTLEENIRNIPESARFNIVLTNPPFGGKEGKHIQQNFPIQSRATELLALQFVMKKLRVGGRCGIVVPEGILFQGHAFTQAKKELLENFNLHTIISLPQGTFANVAPSGQGPKANLLFFDRAGPTKEIWYYDFDGYSSQVLGKKYTKAKPITDDDLKDCFEKWKDRKSSDYSWVVSVEEIVKNGYDLSAKNPHKREDIAHRPPEELLKSLMEKEGQIAQILGEIRSSLGVISMQKESRKG